jgi:hypothetical protein
MSIVSRVLSLLAPLCILAAVATGQTSVLTGQVVDPTNVGLAGIIVKNDAGAPTTTTDALGNFTLTGLQNRNYTIDIIPPVGTYVPVQRSIRVNITTSLGVVTLQPGYAVTGTMLLPNGTPVTNGNVNLYDAAGNKLYTPNDATNALGQFAVTSPIGPVTFRTVTPSALNLVPINRVLDATAPIQLGNLQMQQGYRVTGTFTDAISGVPVGNVRIVSTNGVTGEDIFQSTPTASALGAFSLLLPLGSWDLTCSPLATDAHLPMIKYGVLIVATTALGFVPMQRCVFASGTLTGPNGPIGGADIDVYTADGEKLFTTNDSTTATGTFSVPVPIGNCRLTFQPDVATGLLGISTPTTAFAINTNLGTLTTTPGIDVVLNVVGVNGPVFDANLDLFDPVTNAPAVLTGDHSSATGDLHAIVPAGLWNLALLTPQGSLSAPVRLPLLPIVAPFAQTVFMPNKDLRLNVVGIGIQTVNQGGYLPISLTVENTTVNQIATTIEVVVRYPSGAETTVLPPIPVDVFPLLNLTLSGLFVPTPVVPATEVGRPLRLLVRARDATTTVLEEAYAQFVVQ